jgi:hypothetical protein
MAGFRKAAAQQAALKMGIYGPAGSGKTLTSLLIAEGLANVTGKRIAFVDTERGTDFYCQPVAARSVHPDAFDFDALYTKSLTETLSAIKGIDPAQHGVVVLDSVTHLWEAAIGAYSGRKTSAETIPMHAWGKIKKPYKELMAFLLSSPMHVIFCGRQGTEYATNEETEELKAVGVKMKAEGETPYEPHILIRMESQRPGKSNEVAKIIAYAEKDRTGILSGRSFVNPTFDTLCKPLLHLLGNVQAHVATTDETASVDAEELAEQDRQRAAQSASHLREFCARVELCKSTAELKALGKTITPALKAQMNPADVAALREKYQARESELAGIAVAVPAGGDA